MMRYVVAVLGLVVLLGSLAGLKGAEIGKLIGFGKAMQAAGPPPETVGSSVAEQQDWEGTLSATATITASKGVAVSNDSPGIVARLNFESAKKVRQGEVLVELDTSVERAQLASARARQKLAETSLTRTQRLVTSGAEPQSQLDLDQSTFNGASADVAALEAQITRKTIRAPFSGKLGIRQVNLGQYLAPGTTVVQLEAAESVYVDFTLPQQALPSLHIGMQVRAYPSNDQEQQRAAPAGADSATTSAGASASNPAPARNTPRPETAVEGSISAIDTSVDDRTRTIKVRASLPNDDERLRPGMFARVEVVLPSRHSVVTVPVTALVHASYGDSVFCVEPKPVSAGGKPGKIARQQFVRVGETRGDFVAILDGIKVSQEVVSAGAFKLRNGAPITIDNSVQAKAELAPTPENR